MLRDSDSKYGPSFEDALGAAGIGSHRLPHCSPNLNAFAERLIQSIEVECLDHFLILGTRHMSHLLAEYCDYYNRQRPHSALGFGTPCGPAPPARAGPLNPSDIRCQKRLGGVLRHYYRRAA